MWPVLPCVPSCNYIIAQDFLLFWIHSQLADIFVLFVCGFSLSMWGWKDIRGFVTGVWPRPVAVVCVSLRAAAYGAIDWNLMRFEPF